MLNKIILLTLPAALLLIYSCNNNNQPGTNTATPTQSMVTDATKDDGQGIGKFKNVVLAALDEKLAAEGSSLFTAKCTACHNVTDVKKIGPGLKGITERRQPAWILNMITNPAEMTLKDPVAIDLLALHHTQMTFQDVSDDQAKSIFEFLRKNDSAPAQ